MTSLSKKEVALAAVAYAVMSFVLFLDKPTVFIPLILLLPGLLIIFSHKLMQREVSADEIVAMLISIMILQSPFSELLIRTIGDREKTFFVLASALFVFGFFSATDPKSRKIGSFLSPVVSLLNPIIGLNYSGLILSVLLGEKRSLHEGMGKSKKKKSKKKKSNEDSSIIYVFEITVCLLSLVVSIVCMVMQGKILIEDISFLFTRLKNTFTAVPVIIYLLIRFFTAGSKGNILSLSGVSLLPACAVFGLFFAGWSAFSLGILSTLFSVAYACFRNEAAFEEIKSDFMKYRLVFLAFLFWLII